jgi:hypothetical protein
MKKAKKNKAPQRRTELDQIAAKIRTALRNETKNVIEIGKLLIKSREHLEHGGWQAWLAQNFDLTYRTALNYTVAATYVDAKSETVSLSDFANLSPTVLYRLADGHFDERVEAAILAEARKRRIDEDAAWAIHEKLAPPDDDDADDGGEDDGEDGDEDRSGDEKDAESEAILAAGADPAVPPPAPNPPPTDFALRDFDEAIGTLKRLMTKSSAQFAGSTHNANDLENVASFIRAVTKAKAAAVEVTS